MDKLIDELYEVVVSPERYDDFMSLWGDHLDAALNVSDEISHMGGEIGVSQEIEFEEYRPHFMRAFQLFEKIGRDLSVNESPYAFVTTMAGIGVLIGNKGQIIASSALAAKRLGHIQHMAELQDLLEVNSFKRLGKTVQNVNAGGENFGEGILLMADKDVISGEKHHLNDFMIMQTLSSPELGNHVLLTSPAINWSARLNTTLETSFNLTKKELELVKGLVQGESVREISESKSRSIHTIRTQLKSVLRKCNVHSQANLSKLIVSTAGRIVEEEALKVHLPNAPREGARFSARLPDGRNMDYYLIGPESGEPVLFIHGMLDGTMVTEKFWNELGTHNIRLIAPVRPGFGESDWNDISHDKAPEQFAYDVEFLLNHLELTKPFTTVGHMAGALYAFAVQKFTNLPVKAIVNVSGGVPLVSSKQFACMNPRQRAVAYTARYTPSLLPIVLRAGISQIDGIDSEQFMAALHPAASADGKLLKNRKDVCEILLNGYRFAVSQGHKAFERDSRHVTRDWQNLISKNYSVPIMCIHGEHDAVVDVQSVYRFADGFENRRVRTCSQSGQLILYQNPDLIISEIMNFKNV